MDHEFAALILDDADMATVAREVAAATGGSQLFVKPSCTDVVVGDERFIVVGETLDDDGGVPFSKSKTLVHLSSRAGYEQMKAIRRPMMLVRHLCEPVEEFTPSPPAQPYR